MAGPIQLIGLPSVYPNAREITFNGATGENKINLQDNLADALSVQEGANKYITFITTDGAEGINILKTLYINDTANANMTTGITINQGTADNEILALKSTTDVSHGMTAQAEADTYAQFSKNSGPAGGLRIDALSDTDATAFRLIAHVGADGITNPAIILAADMYDGSTGTKAVASDDTVLQLRNFTSVLLDILGDRTLQFNGASSITTGGNALLTLTGGTAGVRFGDTVGIGSAPDLNIGVNLGRTYTAPDTYRSIYINETITLGVGKSIIGLHVSPSYAEATSATHGTIAGISIANFTVTDGGGSEVVTTLAGLYIIGAPIAGTAPVNGPYAIFIDSGDFRLDGIFYFEETTTPTAIDSFGALYTKSDNKLYFQTGAGVELEIATV